MYNNLNNSNKCRLSGKESFEVRLVEPLFKKATWVSTQSTKKEQWIYHDRGPQSTNFVDHRQSALPKIKWRILLKQGHQKDTESQE